MSTYSFNQSKHPVDPSFSAHPGSSAKMKHTVVLSLFASCTAVLSAGCGPLADKLACGELGCDWSSQEWKALSSLANLPETPPPDSSNRYVGVATAEKLGQKLFFDPRF